MVASYRRLLKWATRRVRNKDIFRQSVSLTFKGKESYASFLGGIGTFLMVGYLLYLAIILTMRMIQRSDVQWSQNTYFTAGIENNYVMVTKEDDLYHVMVLFYDEAEIDISKYMSITMQHIKYNASNDDEPEYSYTNLDIQSLKGEHPDSTSIARNSFILDNSLDKDHVIQTVETLGINLDGVIVKGHYSNVGEGIQTTMIFTDGETITSSTQGCLHYQDQDVFPNIFMHLLTIDKHINLNNIDDPVQISMATYLKTYVDSSYQVHDF